MSERQNQYNIGLDKTPANYVPLSPLSFLARSAAVYPNHVSTVYEGRSFTWRETHERCKRFASWLGGKGIGVGDTVAAMLPNIPAMNEVHFAVPMTGLPGGSATFIAVSILAFVILGSVLEGIPAIVLFGPLLFPIARAVGVHEVHYAMIVILAMGIGLFAPPFGVGYYAACAIGRVDPAEGIRPIWGYLLALMIGLIIVAIFPWISIGFL